MDPQNVQPDAGAAPEAAAVVAGQGEADLTSGLFSLDTVPENLREHVAPLLKQWDGNVTREFQKRAEAWKPYEELGIRDVPTEELGHLMAFRDIASDPDQFKDWVQAAYDELELGQAAAPAPEGGAEGEPQYLTAEQFEQKLAEREAAAEEARHQQELHDTIAREAREALDSFELPSGLKPEEKQEIEDLICHFAGGHMGPDVPVGEALKAGFARYQQMIGAAKSDAIDQKLAQPKPAETGGKPNSQPKTATTFDEARERTLERARASRAV